MTDPTKLTNPEKDLVWICAFDAARKHMNDCMETLMAAEDEGREVIREPALLPFDGCLQCCTREFMWAVIQVVDPNYAKRFRAKLEADVKGDD
jgi:hypothetical protein